MSWHLGPYAAFDVESTGTSVENDRIVTAAFVEIRPGEKPRTRDWLISPGVEIPTEATAIHGISTEQAKQLGTDPDVALTEIAALVCMAFRAGIPVVAMNAPFDLTMLDRELIRYGLGGLAERLGSYDAVRPVLDPYVIDKQVDKYRKGKRTLTALCEHYQVRLHEAHAAGADAIAACRVLFRIAQRYPVEVGSLPVGRLHDLQVGWRAEQQASLAAHFAKQGKPSDSVDGQWPVCRRRNEPSQGVVA